MGTRSSLDWDTTPLNSEGARIFRADANRTYRSEPNRVVMIKLLSFAHTKFGDYQQSLGYVAGLLLLFFDPATVFKVLTVLNDHPKYLPGYWRGEATACAVDGYVCLNLLRPPTRDRLLKLGLLPETFVQKWFAGICIHHLPYHLLFESAPEERLQRTVEAASEQRYVEIVAKLDVHKDRTSAFEEHLSRRLQSANEGMWAKKDDDIAFSDEED